MTEAYEETRLRSRRRRHSGGGYLFPSAHGAGFNRWSRFERGNLRAGRPGGPTPLTATIQFGQPNVGSPFPPDPPHDQSAHAKDNLVPRNVVIRTGGTVTFQVPRGVHQIAIYNPGTDPADIDTSNVTTLAAFAGCAGPPVVNAPLVINDPTNRLAVFPIPCFASATRTRTFNNAGKYLVICAFLPHFEVQMWGWVTVRD